jgi:sec-independent protein translocase protein TatA
MMGFLSPAEIGIIAVVVLLLFGAKKIPELMRGVGSGLRQFKAGLQEGAAEEPAEPDRR